MYTVNINCIYLLFQEQIFFFLNVFFFFSHEYCKAPAQKNKLGAYWLAFIASGEGCDLWTLTALRVHTDQIILREDKQ